MSYLSGVYSYLPSVPYFSSTTTPAPTEQIQTETPVASMPEVEIVPTITTTEENNEKTEALKKLTRNTRIKQVALITIGLLYAAGVAALGAASMIFGSAAFAFPFSGYVIGPTSFFAGYGMIKLGISAGLGVIGSAMSIFAAWKLEQTLQCKRQQLTQKIEPQPEQIEQKPAQIDNALVTKES